MPRDKTKSNGLVKYTGQRCINVPRAYIAIITMPLLLLSTLKAIIET